MSVPGVPELRMPAGPPRSRLLALRALRDCGVVRVVVNAAPTGYRALHGERLIDVAHAPTGQHVDCRLNAAGIEAAARELK